MKLSQLSQLIDISLDLFDHGAEMVAIAYRKKSIISIGQSRFVPHKILKFCKLQLPSVHAEIDAISRMINECGETKKSSTRVDLFVMRYNSLTGGCSKPCFDCLRMLKEYPFTGVKIRKVVYFRKGEVKETAFSDIKTNHKSRGWKWFKGEK